MVTDVEENKMKTMGTFLGVREVLDTPGLSRDLADRLQEADMDGGQSPRYSNADGIMIEHIFCDAGA
jgi:hypothetical protein